MIDYNLDGMLPGEWRELFDSIVETIGSGILWDLVHAREGNPARIA